MIGNRPRKMKGPSDHQYDWVAVGAGRRIIAQVPGHTIHLEIEEVSGIIKTQVKFNLHSKIVVKSMI